MQIKYTSSIQIRKDALKEHASVTEQLIATEQLNIGEEIRMLGWGNFSYI